MALQPRSVPTSAPNVPAPPEAMHSLGGSEFGLNILRLGVAHAGSPSLPAEAHRSGLRMPLNLIHGLSLLAMSIGNVTSFLRIINGDPADQCKFECPTEEAESSCLPWAEICGITSMTIDNKLKLEEASSKARGDRDVTNSLCRRLRSQVTLDVSDLVRGPLTARKREEIAGFRMLQLAHLLQVHRLLLVASNAPQPQLRRETSRPGTHEVERRLRGRTANPSVSTLGRMRWE